MGWVPKSASATSRRSVTHQVLAACLNRLVNDHHPLSVVDGASEGGASGWDAATPDFLDAFQGARQALPHEGASSGLEQMWVLRRSGEARVVLSERGMLFRLVGPPVDLMAFYRTGRRLDDVVQVVLGQVPPS